MSETVVAVLTPAGSAAVATLAVHGPNAWKVCRALFTPRRGSLPESPDEASTERFHLGLFGDGLRDEAILALRRAAPVPWVEIHCHGGRVMVDALVELIAQRGVRVLSWREWFDWTASSRIRAEAARALAEATTVRTAGILLDQYHGALESALTMIREALARGDTRSACEIIDGLLRYANVGTHLTRPWRVVVAGPPNAGKSSLVNALAGMERCIVSEIPGTTRDVVRTSIALDGWPIELIDTAGMREGGDVIEEAGMALAREEAASADLCLWLLDASSVHIDPPDLPRLLPIVNKIDLPAVWDVGDAPRVSARTGEGWKELCALIVSHLVPDPPPPGMAVPFTDEICARLSDAKRACGKDPIAAAAMLG